MTHYRRRMLIEPSLDANKLSALWNSSFSSKSYLVFHRLFWSGSFLKRRRAQKENNWDLNDFSIRKYNIGKRRLNLRWSYSLSYREALTTSKRGRYESDKTIKAYCNCPVSKLDTCGLICRKIANGLALLSATSVLMFAPSGLIIVPKGQKTHRLQERNIDERNETSSSMISGLISTEQPTTVSTGMHQTGRSTKSNWEPSKAKEHSLEFGKQVTGATRITSSSTSHQSTTGLSTSDREGMIYMWEWKAAKGRN